MKYRYKINKLLALIVSFTMTIGMSSFYVYADDNPSDTSEEYVLEDDDTIVEADKADSSPVSEEELDKQAISGAQNDEKIVTIPAEQVKVTCGSRKTLELGKSFQLTYRFKPKKSDDFVTYRSFNRKVVQVSEDGVVTAVGYGTTHVRIKSSSGKKANVYFTVPAPDASLLDAPVSSIELTDKNVMLRKGKTSVIEAVLYPLGTSDALSYSSDNTSVAKVSSSGVITAVNTGSAVITVTAASTKVTATCSITVYDGVFKGIDVSKWQGDINWKRVANAGVDFAMIRSSYGNMHVDNMLEQNVAGCEKNNIPYGFYHYTYADSVSEAKKEAQFFLSTIRGFNPEYPVVLDIEESMYNNMSKKKVTAIITAFVEELENAGYYAMIYSYSTFFNDNVNLSQLEAYDVWIASWGDLDKLNTFYDGKYGIWQYSSTGRISGIAGDVDLNYSYKDYSAVIRRNGLNNLY